MCTLELPGVSPPHEAGRGEVVRGGGGRVRSISEQSPPLGGWARGHPEGNRAPQEPLPAGLPQGPPGFLLHSSV